MTTTHGPYNSDAAARADVAGVYDAARRSNEPGILAQINEGLLLGALGAGGVTLGDYDRHAAGWLASWEPEIVAAVVVGWIERAHAAGRATERANIAEVAARTGDLLTAVHEGEQFQVALSAPGSARPFTIINTSVGQTVEADELYGMGLDGPYKTRPDAQQDADHLNQLAAQWAGFPAGPCTVCEHRPDQHQVTGCTAGTDPFACDCTYAPTPGASA